MNSKRLLSNEAVKALGEVLADSIASHPGFENFAQRVLTADVDQKILEGIKAISLVVTRLDDHADAGCNRSAGCLFGYDDCPIISPEKAEPSRLEKSPREWADLPIEKKLP